ncbi:hypothetical protein KIH41_00645 [Litoribacter ruber]|uniref:Uncharacterized protein n=1 Tax=Litoribacter ruber TaxID=702568 RepID=A0AAP2G4E7_9BACT|nr:MULTISPECIES: hypothetical protein [Litoribacter]MBS9524420.1 hypothetical protein [Litoribacter alkaliphilus]MBT0809782.1 hypothetical protein [Litoribacter ruber]
MSKNVAVGTMIESMQVEFKCPLDMRNFSKHEELKARFLNQMERTRAKEISKGIKTQMINFPPKAKKLLTEYKKWVFTQDSSQVSGEALNY